MKGKRKGSFKKAARVLEMCANELLDKADELGEQEIYAKGRAKDRAVVLYRAASGLRQLARGGK